MKRTGILGAGPSGLALNLFLKNAEVEILERSNRVGGHAASFERDGFTFDYGPHILFSRDRQILDFIVASLGDNVQRCRRNNQISFRNRLVKYPFENDLKSLPPQERFECLYGFAYNEYRERYANPQNLKEWLLKTFGEGICRHYLFPYNRKVWNLEVEELSMLWADRIPNPPAADVFRSALGIETDGYVEQLYYHYPRRGGYQAISDAWARAAKVVFDWRATRIRWKDGGISVSDGRNERWYDRVVSTMPIANLMEAVDLPVPSDVRQACADLIVNPMFIVSLGVRGAPREPFTAIYFPEDEFLVNRVSFPTTFSECNAPAGHYSVQAEITCRADSECWRWNDEQVLQHVVQGLTARGIFGEEDRIVVTDVKRSDLSYVVYDRNYERNIRRVRQFFDEAGIHLLGRFGNFEYINVDQAVARALELAARLNGDSLEQARAEYFSGALGRLR